METPVLASVVVYKPDPERLKENIASVLPQVSRVLLVVNEDRDYEELLLPLAGDKLCVIKNGKNAGIAYALNRAMYYAHQNGFEWVLTLDQDSVCPPDLVEKLLPHTNKTDVAMVAPRIQDRNLEALAPAEEPWEYIKICITSGTLTRVSAWRKAGGFDNRLFIDYVDYDLCARLFLKGFRIVQDNTVCLLHEVGKKKVLRIGKNHRYELYNHAPARCYYYVRNRGYYIKKYPEFVDVEKEKKLLRDRVLVMLLFERKRVRKAIAVLKGIADQKKLLDRA